MLEWKSSSGPLNTVVVDILQTKNYCTLEHFTENTHIFVLD